MFRIFIILLSILSLKGSSQTLGGKAAFNFLHLPSSPLLTAAGGINTSWQVNDAGLAANNPALLKREMHSQLHLSFNAFLGGIKTYSTSTSFYHSKADMVFGGHIFFVDYGSIPQTDAAGNVSGNFRPVDFVVQVGGSKKYLQRWSYGMNFKFISSNYFQYRSSAIAFDAGLLFEDSANFVSASVLVKNMGFQISTFTRVKEDLPFDLQVGFTKKLAKAPFAFSLTAQHVHRFNTVYDDTTFNSENGLTQTNSFFNKLVNHFVVASHIYLGNNLEATLGYNHLRRTELNMGLGGNGLNGFSLGVRINFQKLQLMLARSNYQRNIAYNQLGISFKLDKGVEL